MKPHSHPTRALWSVLLSKFSSFSATPTQNTQTSPVGLAKSLSLHCLWLVALLAGAVATANAQTGSITYVATGVSFSSGFANGGTMTVTYSAGTDATIDPTIYGSAWPSPFTMTFNVSDVIPTDAFTGSPNLIYTNYSQQDDSVSAGLTRVNAELKIDWQSGMTALQKNNNYTASTFPIDDAFSDAALAIYDPSVSATYTTNPYTANSNFLASSQYGITSTNSLASLGAGLTYGSAYSWGMANTGSAQEADGSGFVTAAAKNFSFNEVKQFDFYDTQLATISAEQMFALSSDFATSTKTSGFGITNTLYFNDVVVNFAAVPEPSALLSICAAGTILIMRRRRR